MQSASPALGNFSAGFSFDEREVKNLEAPIGPRRACRKRGRDRPAAPFKSQHSVFWGRPTVEGPIPFGLQISNDLQGNTSASLHSSRLATSVRREAAGHTAQVGKKFLLRRPFEIPQPPPLLFQEASVEALNDVLHIFVEAALSHQSKASPHTASQEPTIAGDEAFPAVDIGCGGWKREKKVVAGLQRAGKGSIQVGHAPLQRMGVEARTGT